MTVGNEFSTQWRVIDDARVLAASTDRPYTQLSAASVEAFQRDGVVLLRNEFSSWVEPLRDGLERNLNNPKQFAFPCDSTRSPERGRFFDSYCNWQLIPEYLLFVVTSSAASIAAQLMASDTAQFFHDHAFAKEKGTAKATPWHHDLPYYCIDGSQTVSIYVALDRTPVSTGVRFVKGSHRNGTTYRPRNFAAGDEYAQQDPTLAPIPDIDPHGANIFVEAVEPGDALCFDFRTLHGTTAEEVTDRRRAFSTRWLGDDMVYCERAGDTSPPLRDLGVPPGGKMPASLFPIFSWDHLKA